MRFLVRPDLDDAVNEITTSQEAVSCAVAFWGVGAERLFLGTSWTKPGKPPKNFLKHRDIKVICNLMSGATNPSVIKELLRLGVQVLHCDTLHAKVYVGAHASVVASANASVNGLGLESGEQDGWIEAGVRLENDPAPQAWFDALWNDPMKCRRVTATNLHVAQALWKDRRAVHPPIDFGVFDPGLKPMPLISWEREADVINDDAKIKKAGITTDMVQWGQEVWDEGDVEVLKEAKWVLCWQMDNNGNPILRDGWPYWSKLIGPVVKGVRKYPNAKIVRDVYLGAEPGSHEGPFDCRNKLFRDVFYTLLKDSNSFSLLKNQKGSYFNEAYRREVRTFWNKAIKMYRSRQSM